MDKLNTPTGIWIAMLLLTAITYGMGKSGFGGTLVVMVLLLTVVLKSTFIIRDFMELRGVSQLWQGLMYGWLLIVTSGIALAYIVAS